jgi:hypothetical protein
VMRATISFLEVKRGRVRHCPRNQLHAACASLGNLRYRHRYPRVDFLFSIPTGLCSSSRYREDNCGWRTATATRRSRGQNPHPTKSSRVAFLIINPQRSHPPPHHPANRDHERDGVETRRFSAETRRQLHAVHANGYSALTNGILITASSRMNTTPRAPFRFSEALHLRRPAWTHPGHESYSLSILN